jgi:DNA-binding IclR family transcriptional regulator
MRTTADTIATRTDLIDELARISKDDYAISRGVSESGINAVAVFLAGSSWRDRIALMASMPADRGTDGHPAQDRRAAPPVPTR